MSSPHLGQGLAVGRRLDGAWVVAYWITARSARSHDRVLVERATEVRNAHEASTEQAAE